MSTKKKVKKAYNPHRYPKGSSRIISYPLTQDEANKLKNPPMVSLQRLKAEQGSRTDLWTVWYRVCVAHNLAKRFYSQEAIEHLEKTEQNIWRKLEQTLTNDLSFILLVPNELEDLNTAIMLANDIQDETNRSFQLEEHQRCYATCLKKTRELESKLGTFDITNIDETYASEKLL